MMPDLEVFATWLNNDTAELDVRCSDCKEWIRLPDNDEYKPIMLSTLLGIANRHTCKTVYLNTHPERLT